MEKDQGRQGWKAESRMYSIYINTQRNPIKKELCERKILFRFKNFFLSKSNGLKIFF